MADNEWEEIAITAIITSLPFSDIEYTRSGKWTKKALLLKRRIEKELVAAYEKGARDARARDNDSTNQSGGL